MIGILRRLFGRTTKHAHTPKKRNPNRIRRLRGDGEFSVKAAGTSHFQTEILGVKDGFRKHSNPDFMLDVVPEPSNEHDPTALQLQHEGRAVGYIPAALTSEIHNALSRVGQEGEKCRVLSRIVGHDKASLGL